MSKNIKLFAALSLVAALSILASSCTAKPAGLTDEQVAGVTENILQAINAADYTAFTRDFNDQMKTAFPKDQFSQIRDMLQNTSGAYLSKGEPEMVNRQGYAIYRFPCEFEKEKVIVTVVFAVGGVKVEGLYFDSPNLRNVNQ
jgi:hypothetical protein